MDDVDTEQPYEGWNSEQYLEARRFWTWVLTAVVSIGAGILIGAVLFW